MIDYLDFFNGYVVGSLEMFVCFYFFTVFLQRKVKPMYYVLFVVCGMVLLAISKAEGIFALFVCIILLMAAGKLFCKTSFASAALYAVVTVEIMNLCFGVFNSLSCILAPIVFEENARWCSFIIMAAGSILALMLSVLCYRAIQRCCVGDEVIGGKYVFMILMPALLIFLISEYINEAVYGNTVTIEGNGSLHGVDPYLMLPVQILGIASLFCVMTAYKKLAEGFRLNKEVALLEMQARSLNQYVSEAKLRYEKTKSFRHDIKNHITVMKELLENKKQEEALRYIEEMQDLTTDISFSVSTNHPILDILIGNKLGIAKNSRIEVQCFMLIPYPCGISDTDFCIILGNALDNAISACNRMGNEKQKYIRVTGKVQGDLLFMEIENSYNGRKNIQSGTGLANIRMVAEKYQGAVEIRTEGEVFVLSVLVIIPQRLERISQQMG